MIDYKDAIEEWFYSCNCLEDVSILYAELYYEIKNQLRESIDKFVD